MNSKPLAAGPIHAKSSFSRPHSFKGCSELSTSHCVPVSLWICRHISCHVSGVWKNLVLLPAAPASPPVLVRTGIALPTELPMWYPTSQVPSLESATMFLPASTCLSQSNRWKTWFARRMSTFPRSSTRGDAGLRKSAGIKRAFMWPASRYKS